MATIIFSLQCHTHTQVDAHGNEIPMISQHLCVCLAMHFQWTKYCPVCPIIDGFHVMTDDGWEALHKKVTTSYFGRKRKSRDFSPVSVRHKRRAGRYLDMIGLLDISITKTASGDRAIHVPSSLRHIREGSWIYIGSTKRIDAWSCLEDESTTSEQHSHTHTHNYPRRFFV